MAGTAFSTIQTYEGPTADEAVLRHAFSLLELEDAELRPEDPPFAWEEFHGLERSSVDDEVRLRWLVTDDEGRPVARARADLPTAHNRHLAVVLVYVAPAHRRQGLGRRLLREVVDAVAADGRTDLVTDIAEGNAGEAFFAGLGGTVGLPQRHSRLDLTKLDHDLLDRWIAAGEQVEGYSLVEWVQHCPDEWLDAFVTVRTAMNGAPHDDLPIDDRVLTPDSVRQRERELDEAHLERWTLAVAHDATKTFAGFTDVIFAENAPNNGWQGSTAVVPEHRGHGFGRWLKAAMARRILERRPSVTTIDTENAFSNGPMLAINVEMGFRLLRTVNGWHAPVATLRERLGEAS
jgi:GNAT superfamily N-acetyltransferase